MLQDAETSKYDRKEKRMEKCYKVSGYCPKLGKELTASVTYIFNTDCWEKGISEPPCANPCEGGCPILASAPAELDNL